MAQETNRLFLLDGMALVYRAHFALIRQPIFTSQKFNTSALYGFTNTLLELLEKQSPTHLAVAFDTSDPTFRHELYPAYKETRDAMPEDLSRQLPHVKRLIEAFNIPVIECPGWEADDIIGTLARRAEAEGDFEVFMVTPDKDFSQLVTEHISIYKPGRQGNTVEILDRETICENWQVKDPRETIDVLGLWGDASDNIPGAPGIGEKTAKSLISRYGSIENIYANIDELKGKQKENLVKFKDQVLLSKQLVVISTEVPVTTTFEEIRIEPRNDQALKNLFVEFEFNSLGKRLFGDAFEAGRGYATTQSATALTATLTTIREVTKQYQFIRHHDTAARQELVARLLTLDAFCFDLETTSLDEKNTAIIGAAFSWEKDHGVYVEFPAGEGARQVLDDLVPVFQHPTARKVGHNLKFDLSVLRWHGVTVAGEIFDTMLAHTLVEPEQRHKMDYLSESLLGYKPISYEEVFGSALVEKGGQMVLFAEPEEEEPSGPPFEAIAEYACEDADVTWQLARILEERVLSLEQDRVLREIECPLVPVLVDMEAEGIRVDPDALSEVGAVLAGRIEQFQESVFAAAGTKFNINSPKQVGEVFFDQLKLVEKPKKTKTGQFKTDEQTLSSLAPAHPIVRDLLSYREAAKLKSTYVDALPTSIFPGTGRIHTTFHQLLTATGRLASNNPNLQNIPIRSEQGREIRKAFIPRDGDHLLLSADYSQIELRVMASLCGDEAMMEAFREGRDIHTATAARVFGVEEEAVTSSMRRTAKMVNFGIIYGISAFGLSQRLNGEVSRSEAANIIEEYFRQYPGVKTYQEQVISQARELGYVETLSGRRRYLRDIDSRNATVRAGAERTAINTPIQGTAADMIKIAMVRVHRLLSEGGYRTRMLLQVHDELVFDLHCEEQNILIPLIEKEMQEALPLTVPVVVESGTGENWLEAH